MKILNRFMGLFISKKACNHKFEIADIMNTSEEPKCVFCDKTLTELNT